MWSPYENQGIQGEGIDEGLIKYKYHKAFLIIK